MRLGIVGHAADKFTPITEALARQVIRDVIEKYKPSVIVSGRSPLGGVDIYAEEIADELAIDKDIYAPTLHQWSGKGGYKDRNQQIADNSDLVVVVVLKELPSSYNKKVFRYCYHCKGRNPSHIKSGGCWTAWRAPKQEWIIL